MRWPHGALPCVALSLHRILGTAFGLGLSPVAPGTAGTLLGVALAVLALRFPDPVLAVFAMAAAVTLLGVPLAAAAERQLGRDPSSFVLDEVAGYLVALLGLPVAERPWLLLSAGFLLFRVFDIAKPWPIGRIDARPGALAIIADDLVAGVYANAGLHLLLLAA